MGGGDDGAAVTQDDVDVVTVFDPAKVCGAEIGADGLAPVPVEAEHVRAVVALKTVEAHDQVDHDT